MSRFSQRSLEFIAAASRQNRPEWLDRRKDEYESVLVEPVKHLVESIAPRLKTAAPSYRLPTRGFARIKRSAQRAAAQGLYKDWVGVLASRDSGSLYEDLPYLYFHLSAEDVFTAAGLYLPSSGQVKKIRSWIGSDASSLETLLEDREFARVYAELGDERKVKTFPRGFPKDHPHIEWLKLTAFYVWRPIPKKQLFSAALPDLVLEHWTQGLRLNNLLDRFLTNEVSDAPVSGADQEESWAHKLHRHDF